MQRCKAEVTPLESVDLFRLNPVIMKSTFQLYAWKSFFFHFLFIKVIRQVVLLIPKVVLE